MPSFKQDLDDNMKKLHQNLEEELELQSFVEIEILLREYWKWLQNQKKELMKQKVENETPELDEDMFK